MVHFIRIVNILGKIDFVLPDLLFKNAIIVEEVIL